VRTYGTVCEFLGNQMTFREGKDFPKSNGISKNEISDESGNIFIEHQSL